MGKEKLMKMFFLDANIFLEVELGDTRSEECKKLFSEIYKQGIRATTSDFIVYTCLLQIENKSSVNDMRDFIVFLDNMTNIEIHSPSYKTIYNAIDLMEKYKLDFEDALVVAIMTALNISELISFDKHFDKVKELKRLEPKDIIIS